MSCCGLNRESGGGVYVECVLNRLFLFSEILEKLSIGEKIFLVKRVKRGTMVH